MTFAELSIGARFMIFGKTFIKLGSHLAEEEGTREPKPFPEPDKAEVHVLPGKRKAKE